MLFRRENDSEAILYRNDVDLFFAVSFYPPTAIRSPQLYPTGPPDAAKRRRAAPEGGGERGAAKRKNAYVTTYSGKTVFRHDLTPTYCATLISTRRSAASKRRLRRCGYVRGGGRLCARRRAAAVFFFL